MAQHDYVIANGTGAAVRSDLNNGLSAIVTQNSGATEPATTYAFMRWADTTAGVMKMRNSANNAWITLYQLDGEWTNIAFENGTAAAPSIYFKDSGTDTGFYSPGANQVGISTGGTARLTIDSNGNVDIDSNTLYVDAANNRVGLGTSTPSRQFSLSDANPTATFRSSSTTGQCTLFFGDSDSDARGAITYENNGDKLGLWSAGGQKLTIDSSGNVGIGTTSPSTNLDVRGATEASIRWGTASNFYGTVFADATLTAINSYNSNPLAFSVSTGTSFSEKARIDTSGRLLIGTSTGRTLQGINSSLQLEGTTYDASSISVVRNSSSNSLDCGVIGLGRSRGSGTTIVASGDRLGALNFCGADGTNLNSSAAVIEAYVDGTPGSNDMPGRLVFSTTADGASSPTERARINQLGFSKFSNNGSYRNANQGYHELYSTSNNVVSFVTATDASYTSDCLVFNVHRAATSAYVFLTTKSGNDADIEHYLRGDGQAYADGSWNGGGADYAEYFEWIDGNPDEEDRRGISVVLDGNQIRPAVDGEDPIGVISGNPSVVGDAAATKWVGKYLRDDYGSYLLDENGERQLNPTYDPDQEYVSREQRPEWDCVGLMGKLRIRKGQPTGSRWIKMRDISASVEEWLVR